MNIKGKIMTKFVYLSDTHWGIEKPGYTMQDSHPPQLPQLLAELEEWMAANGQVDFVLHGGDMIDSTSAENIARAAEHFQLSVPVYLCLGNHDLTRAGALDMWLREAPQFFGAGGANFSVETDDVLLHIAPNQWGPEPYFWNGVQEPHFLAEQERFIEQALQENTDKVHILSTHSPVCGVPQEQTGYDEDFHSPPEVFAGRMAEWARQSAHLACVLGAHSHINTRVEQDDIHYVTSSSFVEVPFDFKLFEIDEGRVLMTTESLLERVGFSTQYDYGKTFVQGRKKDRTIS
jgi:DNA repair exonuclease SbcCD nuclease subunit